MKFTFVFGILAVLLLGIASGCSAKHTVDESRMSKAFASASGETKTEADKAIAAIKSEKLVEALGSIEAIVKKGDLSAEQKQALIDTLVDIQVILSEKPPENADEVFGKLQELQNDLML